MFRSQFSKVFHNARNAFFGNSRFTPFTKSYTPFTRGVVLSKMKLPSSNYSHSGGSRKYSTFFRPSMDGNEKYIVGGIIGANVLVFILWNTYGSASRESHNTMVENFTASYRNLVQGRVHTLITQSFSQQDLPHLFFNMLNVFFFAPYILTRLGTKRFMFIYLTAGAFGALSFIGYQYFQLPPNRRRFAALMPDYCLGASASVFAVNSIFACMHPLHRVYFFFIPMPAVVVFGGLFLYDVYYAGRQRQSTTSHVGHVAGVLTGVAYYFFYLKRLRIV
eukprot:TRINITY_DN686_c0_g2_i1.p1 TRINITY_DN686_c0_g2~~TRINITY_DN686_c0_g2_i1.p1  ORF type:complete len:277 (-),score=25.61 TRINITY_DN686_c0_g2_i1:220-1050(-)